MNKKNNKKGFTLAELLIVVAIIGVLIAIAMPTFGKQLEQARIAADQANLRAAYSEAVAAYLSGAYDGTRVKQETDGGVTVSNVRFTHKTDSTIYVETMPFTATTDVSKKLSEAVNKTISVTFEFSADGSSTALKTVA